MSYSRWTESCWYAYSDVNMILDEPTLTINCDESYPLSDLVDGKEEVLNYFREMRFDRNPLSYHGEGAPPLDRFTEEEIQELREIIDDFIGDHKETVCTSKET